MAAKTAQNLAAAGIMLAALCGLGWTIVSLPLPSLATLTLMEGDVKIEREGKLIPAADGQRLQDKDKIITAKGRAEVQFTDGTTLRASEATRVAIAQGPKDGGLLRSIELSLGTLWFKVNKMTQVADARTEFLTPTAIAAVRGTEGEIGVAADGRSQFTLGSGALDVRSKDGVGRTERITANQMVAVARGKAPTMPVPYTPKPAPLIHNLAPGERGHGGEARGPFGPAGGGSGLRTTHEGAAAGMGPQAHTPAHTGEGLQPHQREGLADPAGRGMGTEDGSRFPGFGGENRSAEGAHRPVGTGESPAHGGPAPSYGPRGRR